VPADPTTVTKPDFRELGISGTRLFAGLISEETVPQLQGMQAYRSYTGMKFDATASCLYKAVELPIRASRWFVNPADDNPKNLQMADFVLVVLWVFGSQSMDDVLRLALGMLPFGFAWLEILNAYIDNGPWKGKVGWHQLAYRSPATKWRWNLDWINGRRQLVSVTQLAPPYYTQTEIPANKLLIFVHEKEGDNWDGISLFRAAWKSYFLRDRLYRVQAIGLERAYMGIPVASLPEGYSDELRDLAKQIVTTIRLDEQAGVVKPEELVLEVLKGELQGTAMHDAIQHHNRQMLLSQLAQFLDLGSGSAGAYSLSSDHSELFIQAIGSRANYVAQVMNLEPGIPSLIGINFANVQQLDVPRLEHGDIGQRALASLGRTLQALGQWGFLTPDDETEDALRRMLDLPERESSITDRALYDLVQQIFPTETQAGMIHQAPRIPSPLTTKAAGALGGAAGGGKGTGPAVPTGPVPAGGGKGDGVPAEDTANMGELEWRLSEQGDQLTQLLARKPWARPRGRPAPEDRVRVRLTEQFAEALEDVYQGVRQGRKPQRPSELAARTRRPYVVRSAEDDHQGVLLEPGQHRVLVTRQMAVAKQHEARLAELLRPRVRAERTPRG
jgi:hypothetical protein